MPLLEVRRVQVPDHRQTRCHSERHQGVGKLCGLASGRQEAHCLQGHWQRRWQTTWSAHPNYGQRRPEPSGWHHSRPSHLPVVCDPSVTHPPLHAEETPCCQKQQVQAALSRNRFLIYASGFRIIWCSVWTNCCAHGESCVQSGGVVDDPLLGAAVLLAETHLDHTPDSQRYIHNARILMMSTTRILAKNAGRLEEAFDANALMESVHNNH